MSRAAYFRIEWIELVWSCFVEIESGPVLPVVPVFFICTVSIITEHIIYQKCKQCEWETGH